MYGQYEELLKEKGVSNYKVSKDTGISQATLSDWKSGKSTPKNDKLQIIADYFGVSLYYLLGKSPFKNNKEAECSIRIAALKKILNNPEHRKFIWDRALENVESGYGFTNETMQYIKNLLNKEVFTDIEYYDLSLFVAWEIEKPEDFNGPTKLVIWETKISCDIDYWSIPKIVVEEWQSNIKYKEVFDDSPRPTAKEAFGGENAIKEIPAIYATKEVHELLEALHKRPEMKTLFSLAKNSTKEDIEKAVKIIEALKGE